MRFALIVAAFVVVFAVALVALPTVPASGQTIPPPRPTEIPPLTPYPTATPNGCDVPGCLVPTKTPAVPTPDRPPVEPTAEVNPARPGLPHANYLVFCAVVGQN